MPLIAGTQFGPYEIQAPLGAGAMGEVYRARDRRLQRDVALKVLPRSLADQPERLTRFEREARLLAALSHPNIAAIHGFEEREGIPALVLELIEGHTLADRIRRGAVPPAEAVAIAAQIADALDAAHEKGIVHRDLKPANIKVTPQGTVKVLDFGIAKALEAYDAEGLDSPTVAAVETRAGMVLGTAAYMSPEQARGESVDRRADIWAFGCVLYEMLTGRVAFAAPTASGTLAAVLTREPDWSLLPDSTPPRIRALLRRCLEKDPKRRLRDIGDARPELGDGLEPAEPTAGVRPGARARTRRSARAGVVLTLALVGAATWVAFRPGAPAEVVRMAVVLPDGVRVTRGPQHASSVAVSPDARTLVVAGRDATGQRLYQRSLDRLAAAPLDGTEGGSSPFFSPDGAWIGFFAAGRLRRVPAGGGPGVDIAAAPAPQFPKGASWGPDDRIVFGTGAHTPLHVVLARGGSAEPLTTLDVQAGETGHGYPELLPDGRTLLFAVTRRGESWIDALDLPSGRRTTLVQGGAPRYASGGHLILSRGTTLLGAPFDSSRLELTGPVVPLVERVATESGGARHYAISPAGALAYVPGARAHALVLLDSNGAERSVIEEALSFENPQFSPDGRRLAVVITHRADEISEVWIHDFATGSASRLTFDGGRAPVWTPDGAAVTFSHLGEGQGIYVKPADGRGDASQLLALDTLHWLVGWTPDGRTLAYGTLEAVTDTGLSQSSIVAFAGGASRRIVGPGEIWGGRLSPDGQWLAYYTLERGGFEIYVTPFPEADTRWLISEGTDPTWAPDGTEIYYRSGDRLMAARIDTAAGVRVLDRRVVVEPFSPPLFDDCDVDPSGRRLVMVRPAGDAVGRDVTTVLNWFTELRRLTQRP